MTTRPRRRTTPLHHDPEALRWVRARSELTQADVARYLHVSAAYVCELEAGTRSAGAAMLNKLAGLFKCPVTILEAHRDVTAHVAALHALADLIERHPALLTAEGYLRALHLELPTMPRFDDTDAQVAS
jgi:transcriptional regulator with XRE-family HTH domain